MTRIVAFGVNGTLVVLTYMNMQGGLWGKRKNNVFEPFDDGELPADRPLVKIIDRGSSLG